jgi:hypothetical protein
MKGAQEGGFMAGLVGFGKGLSGVFFFSSQLRVSSRLLLDQ